MIAYNFLQAFGRLPAHRLELVIRLSCVVLLAAFAIKGAVFAHWGLMIALILLATILLVNSGVSPFGRTPVVPMPGVVAAITVTVLLSTTYLGVPGAIWMFPALVGLRFLGAGAQSGPARLVLVILVPLIALYQGDAGNAARLFGAGTISAVYLWLTEGQLVSLRSKLDQNEGRDPQTGAYTRTRLERDMNLIPQLAPVGLILIRVDGVMALRQRGQGERADQMLTDAAARILPMLSARERLYRLGGEDFLISLAGWRAYESYELGQQIRKALGQFIADCGTEGGDIRIGVAEVMEPEAFDEALDLAYAQLRTESAERPAAAPMI
ncbi:GGDEF domain-containing protein [Phaeobacter sp. B1627]|uniref:GGDEF domain-containing protein n=1 Tax=Phaeobacter sp. B1627 TaxID=2583809 RepID=UPI00111B0C2F|nr:GGDEF domain-containing protein [Phaeobacter sp. B1627]TNJ47815.1 GGDEF domain-containing protein [Phaeobacter sp. B1627]